MLEICVSIIDRAQSCWIVMIEFSQSLLLFVVVFFFFKQKTAYELRISDWSSDVCSSDLARDAVDQLFHIADRRRAVQFGCDEGPLALHAPDQPLAHQQVQRLARRYARYAQPLAQFAFRGQLRSRRIGTVEYPPPQNGIDLMISQRLDGVAEIGRAHV